MDIKFDISDIEEKLDDIEDIVEERMEQRAKEAVKVAKETGNYHDVTGRLRASNGYKIDENGVTLVNSAPYADEVEARGKNVLSSAILYLHDKLKEDFKK